MTTEESGSAHAVAVRKAAEMYLAETDISRTLYRGVGAVSSALENGKSAEREEICQDKVRQNLMKAYRSLLRYKIIAKAVGWTSLGCKDSKTKRKHFGVWDGQRYDKQEKKID